MTNTNTCICYSLIGIFDLLETRIPVLTDDSGIAMIMKDIKAVLNGVRGLKTLRDSLKLDIPLKSVNTRSFLSTFK